MVRSSVRTDIKVQDGIATIKKIHPKIKTLDYILIKHSLRNELAMVVKYEDQLMWKTSLPEGHYEVVCFKKSVGSLLRRIMTYI